MARFSLAILLLAALVIMTLSAKTSSKSKQGTHQSQKNMKPKEPLSSKHYKSSGKTSYNKFSKVPKSSIFGHKIDESFHDTKNKQAKPKKHGGLNKQEIKTERTDGITTNSKQMNQNGQKKMKSEKTLSPKHLKQTEEEFNKFSKATKSFIPDQQIGEPYYAIKTQSANSKNNKQELEDEITEDPNHSEINLSILEEVVTIVRQELEKEMNDVLTLLQMTKICDCAACCDSCLCSKILDSPLINIYTHLAQPFDKFVVKRCEDDLETGEVGEEASDLQEDGKDSDLQEQVDDEQTCDASDLQEQVEVNYEQNSVENEDVCY